MNVEDPSRFFVPPRAAFTGQVPRLFSDALENNILLGLDVGSVNMGEAIRLAVFERDVEEMEQGLQTLVGPRGVRRWSDTAGRRGAHVRAGRRTAGF